MANDELVGKVRRCRDPNIGPRNSGDGVRPPREEKERRPKNARMALLLLWSIVNKQLAKNEVDLSELLKDESNYSESIGKRPMMMAKMKFFVKKFLIKIGSENLSEEVSKVDILVKIDFHPELQSYVK
ncbi:hypothetical protein HPP92_026935 [Vanilla planifolia]|uniref:Uncharacterized protein n=1 Tax=Vanilla planifolia TaxID=51239 RepID=A0A835PAK8_VANPL|nr:hypothetical protein HPP92_026935 [Vanilla planifolia]